MVEDIIYKGGFIAIVVEQFWWFPFSQFIYMVFYQTARFVWVSVLSN